MLDEFVKHLLIDVGLLLILGAVASKLFLILKNDLQEVKTKIDNLKSDVKKDV
jgi:hypothetical protein